MSRLNLRFQILRLLLLAISITSGLSSTEIMAAGPLPKLRLERDLQGSEYSQVLKLDERILLKIDGVGPQMEILSLKPLRCKTKSNLYILELLVGSAGTKSFSYVERSYVLEFHAKKPQDSKIHFEYLSRITRDQGTEKILDLRRESEWNLKACKLHLKSFDEEAETFYEWKKGLFEKTTKELDLDLEESLNQ